MGKEVRIYTLADLDSGSTIIVQPSLFFIPDPDKQPFSDHLSRLVLSHAEIKSMLNRHLIFTIIFLIIAIANLYADIYLLRDVRLFVKPLICISLGIYFIQKVKLDIGFNRLILAAIIFSFFGD